MPPAAPQHDRRRYWRTNLRYLALLLAVWFAVSFGCGILMVDVFDRWRLGGFKLGFWFAQQGSMYVFVALIFVYVWLMNRLDRRHDVHEQRPGRGEPAQGQSGDDRRSEPRRSKPRRREPRRTEPGR